MLALLQIKLHGCVRATNNFKNIRQLAELVEQHCPVMDTLMRGVSVSGKVEVLKSTETSEAAEKAVAIPA